MYEFLVEGEMDFVGKMAYVLYKEHKREVISKRQKELGNKEVPVEFIEYFTYQQKTPKAKESYRADAENILNAFTDGANREKGINLDKEYIKEYRKLARNVSLWQGILASVIGSIAFVFIGYLLLNFSGVWDKIIKLLS